VLLIIHNVETSNPTFFLCLPDMYMHELLLSCPVIVFLYSTVYVYTNLSYLVNFFFMQFIRMYLYLEKYNSTDSAKLWGLWQSEGTWKVYCKPWTEIYI
jgi:hypothetical protein